MVKQKKKKINYRKKILVCLGIMLILINCLVAMVQAGSYVQGQKGNFRLTLQETDSQGNQTPLSGVKLKLYKIGVVEFDGNVHFKLDNQLASTGVDFEKLESAGDWYTAAETLATVVEKTSLTPTEAESDAEGKIAYSDLEEGMYLIIGSADSTADVTPMLLSMPFVQEDEGWVYDVQAYPKAVKKDLTTTGITVTKRLYYIDQSTFERTPMQATNESFKIGLFLDKDGTIPYGNDYVKTVNIQNADSGTVSFDDVPNGTYYIFELDSNNKATTLNQAIEVSEGRSFYYNVTDASEAENNSVAIDKTSNPKATVYVNNNYYYLPDGFYLEGQINIKKRVVVDGQETKVNDTFYAGVFQKASDGTLTLVQNTELKQNDTVTVKIPFSQSNMPDSISYVVKETDKDGKVLNTDSFPYEISGEGTVTLEKSKQYKSSIELTNTKNSDTTKTTTNESGNSGNNGNNDASNHSGSTSQQPVKTGDTSNPALWAILLIISAVVIIGFYTKRKRNTKK